MSKLLKRRSKKAGLPPGSLVYVGERALGKTRVSILDYDEQRVHERVARTVEECVALKDDPTVTWVDVDGLGEAAAIEQLGRAFGLHPLVLEDVLTTDQRPRLQDYGAYAYVVLKMLSFDDAAGRIVAEQVSLILGPAYVISFQEVGGDVFDPVRQRIRSGAGRIRKQGADYLAYCLLDIVVDNYFAILEKLGERVELLEEELIGSPSTDALGRIHGLRREMILLRKSVWPLREVVNGLERGESPLVRESTEVYLRDVYDHTVEVMDTIETLRDMLTAMLDIYLSSVSNRLNSVMKVLTIISTVFMPLTFVAGIYGMNFDYMPELRSPYGYPVVLALMLLVSLTMLALFRRKGWL